MSRRVLDFFRSQSRNFKVLVLHGIFVGGGMREGVLHALTRQYTNLYIVALGATKVQLGLIQSMRGVVRTTLSVPVGWVIDQVSLKKMLLLGMMLGFLAPLMYALAGNWYMVIPAVLIISISGVLRGPAHRIFLTSSLEDANRATGFSILRTVGSIPGIVMPFLSAYIVESFGGINPDGIRPLFYIQFIFLVPLSLWVYRSLKEPKRDKSVKSQGFLRDVRKFLAKGPKLWLLVGVFDSFGMLAFPFLMIYAVEVKGATTSTIALMGVASTLATMLFTIPFGRLADRIGRKPVL